MVGVVDVTTRRSVVHATTGAAATFLLSFSFLGTTDALRSTAIRHRSSAHSPHSPHLQSRNPSYDEQPFAIGVEPLNFSMNMGNRPDSAMSEDDFYTPRSTPLTPRDTLEDDSNLGGGSSMSKPISRSNSRTVLVSPTGGLKINDLCLNSSPSSDQGSPQEPSELSDHAIKKMGDQNRREVKKTVHLGHFPGVFEKNQEEETPRARSQKMRNLQKSAREKITIHLNYGRGDSRRFIFPKSFTIGELKEVLVNDQDKNQKFTVDDVTLSRDKVELCQNDRTIEQYGITEDTELFVSGNGSSSVRSPPKNDSPAKDRLRKKQKPSQDLALAEEVKGIWVQRRYADALKTIVKIDNVHALLDVNIDSAVPDVNFVQVVIELIARGETTPEQRRCLEILLKGHVIRKQKECEAIDAVDRLTKYKQLQAIEFQQMIGNLLIKARMNGGQLQQDKAASEFSKYVADDFGRPSQLTIWETVAEDAAKFSDVYGSLYKRSASARQMMEHRHHQYHTVGFLMQGSLPHLNVRDRTVQDLSEDDLYLLHDVYSRIGRINELSVSRHTHPSLCK